MVLSSSLEFLTLHRTLTSLKPRTLPKNVHWLRTVNTNYELAFLQFRAQGHHGVEAGGFAGGVDSEKDADGCGEKQA